MPSWKYTDDPNDPCIYCIQWTERGRPYRPDGSTVPRVCRTPHERCAAAVAELCVSTGEV